jgi:hypothetical protein
MEPATVISNSAVSIQTLSALENAVEPYRQAGYVIIFQSDLAITLHAPVRQFSWALFLTGLFLLWPVAIVYLIRFNQQKDRTVCVRITSQGQVEASGYTLDLLETECQRRSAVKQ